MVRSSGGFAEMYSFVYLIVSLAITILLGILLVSAVERAGTLGPLQLTLIAYLLVVALLCMYVPWRIETPSGRLNQGYSFFWELPFNASVDFPRILLELAAATALFAVVGAILRAGARMRGRRE